MITITRRFEFDSAHRVWGHESKCKHLHGHRYVAELTVTSNDLDNLGRVIDFSVVKDIVGRWIDNNWDHNILLHPEDRLGHIWTKAYNGTGPCHNKETKSNRAWMQALAIFDTKAPYIFPKDTNPTAENIAKVLFENAARLLKHLPIKVTHCRVYETPNCFADYHE